MPSEFIQRQIDALLAEAAGAMRVPDWATVAARAEVVLRFDPENEDAKALLAAARPDAEPAAQPSGGATPPPEATILSSLPRGEGGTIADASAVPSASVGEGLVPSRPEREPGTAAEGAGTLTPALSQRAREEPALPGNVSPTADSLLPTAFVNGRYEVERLLGEGGKKKVYLARDTALRRSVAFALIKTEGLDETGRERIRREGEAMGALGAHPHIVTVFDLGEEHGQPYMTTELMGGGDVEGVIEKASEHKLPLAQALQIADEVCQGLEFAHSKGIVHRDLKPGNVWLTEAMGSGQSAIGEAGAGPTADSLLPTALAGTAKIGDFGLAVSLDRTRLTQAGMMVGTVGYMPPEQATGGQITPRSDLYSLGAMLYEMVCGRPPFIGDDAIAIIGQHLNVPPVSPAWHRPDCPPGLEAIILRLLEKDPGRRPGSAGEVRSVLQSISGALEGARAGLRPVPTPSSVGAGFTPAREPGQAAAGLTAPANPLYRRVFIGREAELRQLQAAYDAAGSGHGSLAVVLGEPGVGKTSICEQLATYAAVRGGKALVGHSYEEGSLSLPYLPFVEAMRSYVLARDPAGLAADLGSGAGDVARIVSEIRDRVPDSVGASTSGGPSPAGDAEGERWRLLQAVTGFLHNASLVQPLMIVLEDLHDADRGTLDLLVHLAHNLQGARLLIVGTYRDVEVDRTHPLSAALAELRRSGGLLRVPLRGLTVDEVHRMYEAVRGNAVPWSQAELVHRQTEGNPLFVQEVLRYLVEEGIVVREGGRYVRADDRPADSLIPEGLRDVVGRRLSRLSPQANQVLSVAAVIGRDFRMEVLSRVAGLSESELEAALEEATARSVIEQHQALGAVGFRFTHAFFRQTLYEEIFIPRRIRLHQQVGRVLEGVYNRRPDEHAAELAEHFVPSTETADLEKALRYSQLAAQRALAVFAYGEAVRHYEQALRTQEVLDPDDKTKRCDLLLALGEAMLSAGEPRRAVEQIAPEALELAEGFGDRARASGSCYLACSGLFRYGAATMLGTPLYRQWAEQADRYAMAGTVERVYADVALGQLRGAQGRWSEMVALYSGAIALARQLGDNEAVFQAAWPFIRCSAYLAPPGSLARESTLQLVGEVCTRPRTGAQARTIALVLSNSGVVYADAGDRTRAEAAWGQLGELAERTRDAYSLFCTTRLKWTEHCSMETSRSAAAAAARLPSYGDALGSPVGGRQMAAYHGLRALLHLNRAGEVLRTLPEVVASAGADADQGATSLIIRARTALGLAYEGRSAESRTLLAQVLTEGSTNCEDWQAPTQDLVVLLEAAVLLGDRDAAGRFALLLAPAAGSALCGNALTCAARHLGAAAALLGEREQAIRYYEEALAVCGRLRFRPEIALTRLGIAELLLDGGDRFKSTEALDHLDFAIAEFREMKMQPALERALRHKELLKA